MSGKAKPVNSRDYKVERFGILNYQGEFWTPDTFKSEEDAREHIRQFWTNPTQRADFERRSSIIPVYIVVKDARPSPARAKGGAA